MKPKFGLGQTIHFFIWWANKAKSNKLSGKFFEADSGGDGKFLRVAAKKWIAFQYDPYCRIYKFEISGVVYIRIHDFVTICISSILDENIFWQFRIIFARFLAIFSLNTARLRSRRVWVERTTIYLRLLNLSVIVMWATTTWISVLY